jgi:GntR family transcriptional regulator
MQEVLTMSNANYKSPLYIQLREVIRNKIEDGEYPVGTAIPSESQLAEAYNLNPLSVRSALAALKYEGLLRSIQGKGVFVNGPKTERDLESLGGYRQTMDERSIDAHTRVLIKALRPAGPYYSRLLDLEEDDRVWFTRRIDYMNQEPAALEEIYIPEKLLPSYGDVDIELFSIYDIFIWNGLRPTDADQTLRVVFLEPSRAKLIDLTPDDAVMELSNLTRDAKGRKIEFARNYVRPDKIEFVAHYAKE